MEEIKEITREEFYGFVEEMKVKAGKLGKQAEDNGWEFPASTHSCLYFYNDIAKTPCLYRRRRTGVGDTGTNPLTGKRVLLKPVPKGYRINEKAEIAILHHLTLDGCPKLIPFKTEVGCAFYTIDRFERRYYTCTHLVGQCPAKE